MRIRPRRNRGHSAIRDQVRENAVSTSDLVQPYFLVEGSDVEEPIPSLPGQYRRSKDRLLKEVEDAVDKGINSFILFPAIDESLKDKEASYGFYPKSFYLDAIHDLKKNFPDAFFISDIAMDPYSSDGHDGLVKDGKVLNDETLPILEKMALAQAEAGIDMVGPSDMMDGRVGAIRDRLDENGYLDTGIMSYTAKYASSFYGPFRDALDSTPKAGDKKTYQMDPGNSKEALLEAELDEQEGADILMVKPALHYLDVISSLKGHSLRPIAAYHVSGEYAMLKAAVNYGWLDNGPAMHETLLSLKRAGADIILTYMAKEYAELQA